MNKFITLAFCLLLAVPTMAQNSGKGKTVSAKEMKAAKKWNDKGCWRNGFTKAEPDKSVNLVTFQDQYKKNTKQWKALFEWLQKTDLLSIPKGKHPIEGTTLVASVEDSQNGDLSKRRSESHRRKIDFQYTVKGTEGFCLIDNESSTPNCKYDSVKDVIHYDYDKDKMTFIESDPNKFFIFFPQDWHIAKVATTKEDQTLRVIVIKVDYVE